MANYSPQTNYFETSMKLNKAYNFSYWLVFVLSIIATVLNLNSWVEYVSIFSIIYLSVLDFIGESYKLKAERIRRSDFIDNSFGTKFVHDSSDAYYDNDEVEIGLKKCMTNLFENTFFSYNVSKEMVRKKTIKNLLFFLAIICLAIYGFSRSNISLPLLQLYLSRYFVLDLIRINSFHQRSESCFDELKKISNDVKENKSLSVAEITLIKTLVDYEAGIAEYNVILDSKVFNEMNQRLTSEWIELKKKYIDGGNENERD